MPRVAAATVRSPESRYGATPGCAVKRNTPNTPKPNPTHHLFIYEICPLSQRIFFFYFAHLACEKFAQFVRRYGKPGWNGVNRLIYVRPDYKRVIPAKDNAGGNHHGQRPVTLKPEFGGAQQGKEGRSNPD